MLAERRPDGRLSQTHGSKAGAVIAVDAGDTITLVGVTVAQLQAAQQAHVDWLHFFWLEALSEDRWVRLPFSVTRERDNF